MFDPGDRFKADFCIFRTSKLRTDGNVAGSISHALRTRETPNADPNIENWTNMNVKGADGKSHLPENALEQAMARFHKTLPKKMGKGRVPCIELLMTVSPEVMARKDFNSVNYLNDCDKWAEEVFGKENVFLRVHHKDETTPHTSIFIVPKVKKIYKDGHTEEVLAAKQWLGGREKLSKLQDDFFEKVGLKHGLKRGIKNSKAKHQTVKKYYAKINQLEKEFAEFSQNLVANIPSSKGMFTTIIDSKELEPYLKNQVELLKPYFEKLAKAEEIEQRYKALQNTFDELVKTKVNCEVAKKIEPIKAEKENLERKLNQDNITIKYPDGVEIPCPNGILNGLKERAENALQFRSLTTEGVKALAERMELMNIQSADEALEIAKSKGLRVVEWLDTPIEKKRIRGYGGMSYDD